MNTRELARVRVFIISSIYIFYICFFVVSTQAVNPRRHRPQDQPPRKTASSYFVQYAKNRMSQQKSSDENEKSDRPARTGRVKESSSLSSPSSPRHTSEQTMKAHSDINIKFNTLMVPNTLFLRHAEIKLFSGHLLNFLRVKCPKVDSVKINLLQKYISSRTQEPIHHASDKKSAFNLLLTSLRVCSSSSYQQKLNFKQPDLIQRILVKLKPLRDYIYFLSSFLLNYFSKNSIQVWLWPGKLVNDFKRRLIHMLPMQNLWTYKKRRTQNEKGSTQFESQSDSSESENNILFHFVRDGDGEASKWRLISRKAEKEKETGKKAFEQFLETLLKLYTSQSCSAGFTDTDNTVTRTTSTKSLGKSKKLQIFFKAASNDLLDYFSIDDIRANLAAAKFIPQDFLESVDQCVSSHTFSAPPTVNSI